MTEKVSKLEKSIVEKLKSKEICFNSTKSILLNAILWEKIEILYKLIEILYEKGAKIIDKDGNEISLRESFDETNSYKGVNFIDLLKPDDEEKSN